MNINLDADSIAVIIDAWYAPWAKSIHNNIRNFCYNNPAIKAIFVANYTYRGNPDHNVLRINSNSSKYYYLPRDQRLIDNAKKYYSKKRCSKATDRIDTWWTAMNQSPKRFSRKDRSIELIESYGPICPDQLSPLDPIIRDMPIRKDQEILPVWTKSQMEYLITWHWPKTKNIYMMGGAWQSCVRNRPTGYLSIQDSINTGQLNHNIKILSLDKTVSGWETGNTWGYDKNYSDADDQIDHPAWKYLPGKSDLQLYYPDEDCRSLELPRLPWAKSIKFCEPGKQ